MKPGSPRSDGKTSAKQATSARRRRWLPWIAGAVLVALIVVGLWPKAQPVEVATVTRGDLLVTVNEEGMTRVKNRYVISSPVAGQLQRIDWKAGAEVIAGETVLAVLETSGADFLDARSVAQAEARVRASEAAREAAAAQRERAAAEAKLAAMDFERLTQLRGQDAISAQEFEAAEMRATAAEQQERAARFSLQVATFELEQARAVLLRGRPDEGVAQESRGAMEPLIVTSPVSGRVLRVFQESSRVVPAGMALLEVGDPTDLELRIELLSRDGVAVQPGARVIVEQWGGMEPLEARVRLVEPSAFTKISALGVEEQRVYVIADLVNPVEERPTLGDNYRIEGHVVVWEGRDVLKAPAGALFQRGQTWQTFVVSGGRVALREVEVGRTNGRETAILGGLNEGERVVVYPGDAIADGVRVREVEVGGR